MYRSIHRTQNPKLRSATALAVHHEQLVGRLKHSSWLCSRALRVPAQRSHLVLALGYTQGGPVRVYEYTLRASNYIACASVLWAGKEKKKRGSNARRSTCSCPRYSRLRPQPPTIPVYRPSFSPGSPGYALYPYVQVTVVRDDGAARIAWLSSHVPGG